MSQDSHTSALSHVSDASSAPGLLSESDPGDDRALDSDSDDYDALSSGSSRYQVLTDSEPEVDQEFWNAGSGAEVEDSPVVCDALAPAHAVVLAQNVSEPAPPLTAQTRFWRVILPVGALPQAPSALIWASLSWYSLLQLGMASKKQCLMSVLVKVASSGLWRFPDEGAPPSQTMRPPLISSLTSSPRTTPLPSTQSGSGLTSWRQRWDHLLGFHSDKTIPCHDIPKVLFELCSTLPSTFAGYCAQLAGVAAPGIESHPGGPTANEGRRRQRDLLPLPQARFSAEELPRQNSLSQGCPGRLAARAAWITLMIAVINFHYCLGGPAEKYLHFVGPCTAAQHASHIRLGVAADAFIDRTPADLQLRDWTSDLRNTSVSYGGEEVAKCIKCEAELLAPGLPPAELTGSIPLAELCEGRTRDVLLRSDLARRKDDSLVAPWPPPRIHATSLKEKFKVLKLLWDTGIVEAISEEDMWSFRGVRVKSGLFAVGKAKKCQVQKLDGSLGQMQRLIINLVPVNGLHDDFDIGENDLLPSEGQFNSLYLLPMQQLLMSARDRRCFFYIFSMPQGWSGVFALAVLVPWHELGVHRPGSTWLGVRVCAMGWRFATALCQAAHRRMLIRGYRMPCPVRETCCETVLPEAQEVRRDRAFPIQGCRHACGAWSIYIDNLDLWELVDRPSAVSLLGTEAEVLTVADRAYAVWHSPESPEDRVDRALVMRTLGVVNDGDAGRRDVPPECFEKLMSLVLFLLGSNRVTKRDMQIVAGRSLRYVMRNRSCAVNMDHIWRAIAHWTSPKPIPPEVVTELLGVLCLAPLGYTDLRLKVAKYPSCSDASYSGGACCVATQLTAKGKRRAQGVRTPCELWSATELALVSLFDGVGGARRSWELLNLPVSVFIAVEQCPQRRRVCRNAWPHVVEYTQVEDITPQLVRTWANKYSRVRHVVAGGGFPCSDMSRLRGASRQGIQGKNSKLVHHLPRIWSLIRQHWPAARLWRFAENVSSSRIKDIIGVNALFNLLPNMIESGEFTWVRRGRYYWTDWKLDEAQCTAVCAKSYCRDLHFHLPRGPCEEWLDAGSFWPGALVQRPMPTFVRHVPRRRPPSDPRDLDRCSDAAKRRWAAAHWPEVCAHFEVHNMIVGADGAVRLPSIAERERLHFLREGHTLGALRSSEAKSNPKLDFAVRASMLGDGYQHLAVAWIMGNLACQLGYLSQVPTIGAIRAKHVYPLHVSRQAQCWGGVPLRWEASLPERLSRWLLSRVDARGSDIRLCTGELLKPHRVSRQACNPHLWRWRAQMSWTWRRADAHINELEAIAVLVQLKARARSIGGFNTVFLHLVDSQVALGVFMKRRSSSRLLQRVLRRANAICLACNLLPIFIYVRSELNPSDAPSRGKVQANRNA